MGASDKERGLEGSQAGFLTLGKASGHALLPARHESSIVREHDAPS
jgi:hypothetical protein